MERKLRTEFVELLLSRKFVSSRETAGRIHISSAVFGLTCRAQTGEIVSGVVARPRQRRGRDHQETLAERRFLVGCELIRRDEPVHGVMLGRGLQILPDGQKVDIGRAHVVHHLQHLLARLAQPDHDTGFGERHRVQLLDPLQQAQAVEIARTSG